MDPMSEPTDEELVQRSLAGETRAFAQLVEKHQRLVFGVALSGACDLAQAEDVAQEAFVEAWRDLPRLRDRARAGSWIAGIARNLGRRWARHTARRRTRETIAMHAPREAAPTPLDSALDAEMQALLRSTLATIPAAYREALVLYYVHGRSIAEVATGLGISDDLVKQRLSRGRRALRASLEARLDGALDQLRPSTAFTGAVMLAVAATTRKAVAAGSASGKAIMAMKTTKLALVGIALVIAGALTWYASRGRRQPAQAIAPASAPPKLGEHTDTSPAAQPASDNRPGTVRVRKLASRAAHDQLVVAIRRANQHRVATAPAIATSPRPRPPLVGSADAADDDPDKDYVQEAMVSLLPMIVDCYKQARATTPTLAGKLVVHFTIEGDPDTGGVVTESSIDPEQSEIHDPGLAECVEETMFALEIDPPANGGTVKVTYPFTFGRKS
jgi:RNA polymerase sigma factor (sigma-70 family)